MEAILDILFKAASEQDALTLNQACAACGLDSNKIIKHVETDEKMACSLLVLCTSILENVKKVQRHISRHIYTQDIDKLAKFYEEQEQFRKQIKYIGDCMPKQSPILNNNEDGTSFVPEQENLEDIDVEKLKNNISEVFHIVSKVYSGVTTELSKDDLVTLSNQLEYILGMVEELVQELESE